jgi:hypothetical protein
MRRFVLAVFTVFAAFSGFTTALAQLPSPAPNRAGPAVRVASRTPTDPAIGAEYPGNVVTPTEPTPADYNAERAKIWNSPEMVEARKWVAERARVSKQTKPEAVAQYLARLEKLPPSQMRRWLSQYKAYLARAARAQAVDKAARQIAVENAIRQLENRQHAYLNINLQQDEAADAARQKMWAQQFNAINWSEAKRGERDLALLNQRVIYDPFAPTLDPASPDAYTRYAATASLPGDLPRGDAGNSIRGEEGISTGQGEPGP